MTKLKVTYFEPEDVLHLLIAEGTEVDSIELSPQITAELNANGELIGVEIFKASSFLRDFLLETVQVKLLDSDFGKNGMSLAPNCIWKKFLLRSQRFQPKLYHKSRPSYLLIPVRQKFPWAKRSREKKPFFGNPRYKAVLIY